MPLHIFQGERESLQDYDSSSRSQAQVELHSLGIKSHPCIFSQHTEQPQDYDDNQQPLHSS